MAARYRTRHKQEDGEEICEGFEERLRNSNRIEAIVSTQAGCSRTLVALGGTVGVTDASKSILRFINEQLL